VRARSRWRLAASYAGGVWGGLTAWAALAQYVLPGRGNALGKLGSFHWVLLINVFPALLCALGVAIGLAIVRSSEEASAIGARAALSAGLVFPVSLRLLRPLFGLFGAGMIPGLVWCVLGSVGAGALLGWWGRQVADPRGMD
jgi:hypothetical protein